MDIIPQLHESAPLITRYGGGAFTIGAKRVEGSVFVTRQQFEPVAAMDISALAPAELAELIGEDTEILLIGTGVQHHMLPLPLRQFMEKSAFNFDSMDTGAACRTFNILLAEDRRVAALLIAV